MTSTDTELIERSREGDAAAFEQLVFRYDRDVLNIASRFTASAEDAKDIYQESFLRVYRGLASFEGKSEFTTWLYRIVTNVCLSYKAKKQRMAAASIDEDEDGEAMLPGSGRDEAAQGLAGRELTDRINAALQKLSPQQRLVFTLRHEQEYKLKEIAVMMGCAEGTVKKYLFEATQRMRERLHDLYE